MQTDRSFTFRSRVRSFRYAVRGVLIMLRSQHNAWVHAVVTVGVCGAGAVTGLGRGEWSLIILAIMAVWTAEALNTALEFLAEVASPGFHHMVQRAKDVAAGAVLISALGAAVIGALILGPRITALF